MKSRTRTAGSRIAASLSTAAVAAALLLNASPASGQGLSLGVEGGPTFADFSVSDGDAELGSKTGFRVAGVIRYGFGGPLGLQTGIGLSQKGASASQEDVDYNLSYVEVPLLLTATIPTPAPVSPRIYGGGQVGFESSCEIAASTSGLTGSFDCSAEQLGEAAFETKSSSYGLVFGGGLDFNVSGPVAITVDGRYELGLSDINDVTDPNVAEVKNRSFSASAGILLSLP